MFKILSLPKSLLLVLSCLFLNNSKVFAQTNFIIHDVLATSNEAFVIDPEYNTVLNKVCWQSAEDELWICSLDSLTHLYVPADGKGVLVADSLRPFIAGGWNGPEWMLSTLGTQVVFTQIIGNKTYPSVATLSQTGWSSFPLPYQNTIYMMGSHDYADSVGLLLFETRSGYGIKWMKNTDFNTLYESNETTLGFFSYNGSDICCVKRNSYTPGYITITNNTFTPISSDTVNAPFMWKDPESGQRMYLYRTEGGKKMVVLKEDQFGNWDNYNTFYSPMLAPYSFIASPEPFVFGGKSYISFMASQSADGNEMLPSQIWFAGVNPSDSLVRKVGNSAVLVCFDPEPVVFPDSAFIFYSEKHTIGMGQYILRVRKCDTGLGQLLTENNASKKIREKILVFPNPSYGEIIITAPFHNNPGNNIIQIFDMKGNLALTAQTHKRIFKLDLTFLCAGYYTVKIINNSNEATSKIMILH